MMICSSLRRSAKAAHTRITCLILAPDRDDGKLWFTRYLELYILAGLEENHLATKVFQFFDPKTISTVYSMGKEEHQIYKNVKNVVLTRYTYPGR